MPDRYNIYIVNNSLSTQLFCLFLAPPRELADNQSVYANSSAFLTVQNSSPGENLFSVPLEYQVGAGASYNAVAPGLPVISNVTVAACPNDIWAADYADVPPPIGPTLTKVGTGAGAGQIRIQTNTFNQPGNESNGWFGNQSFGVQSDAGFTGMTWSPNSSMSATITPEPRFFVAIGPYESNGLVSFSQVSEFCCDVFPDNFEGNNCTVTYTEGLWALTSGPPNRFSLATSGLRAQ